MKQKIALWQRPGFVIVDDEATVGAVLGKTLTWPDGRPVQLSDLGGGNADAVMAAHLKAGNPHPQYLLRSDYVPGGGGSSQVNADWDATSGVAQILNKPANVVESIVAGTNVTVDNTDPKNPKVSAAGGSSVPVAWNPLDCHNQILLCSDNAIVTPIQSSPSASVSVRANKGFSSGKNYFEVNVQYQGLSIFSQVGLMPATGSLASGVGSAAGAGWSYYQQTGNKIFNGVSTAFGATWGSANNVVGCAFDLTAGAIWFSMNGVWQASGNPATGANPAFTGLTGTLFPAVTIYGGNGATLRGLFKASLLNYAPPTGFSPVDH